MSEPREFLRLALGAILAHGLRSRLTVLGIVIGIASMILLTALGEGTRRSLVAEFSQFGTNLMAVHRGKTETTGIPGAVGGTVRSLTVEDAEALKRLPQVERVVPVAFGAARVEFGERGRSVFVYGVTSDVPEVWRFRIGLGRFLPAGDPRRAAPLAVIGPTLKRELFGAGSALGQHVRIGGRRFLVIGVMAAKGRMLGFDVDDFAYIPVASAQSLFRTEDLMEIDLLFSPGARPEVIKERVRRVLLDRHGGHEDFTVTTQTEMLDSLDRILDVVTLAVAGIGAVSLLVGAVGILTIMWISVGERSAEIGLSKALGATRRQILRLFLIESALLAGAGGVLGVLAGLGLGVLGSWVVPLLEFRSSPLHVLLAFGLSVLVGIASGVLPARRAAALDPIEALHAE